MIRTIAIKNSVLMCRQFPYLVNAAIEIEQKKFLRPIVSFSKGRKGLSDSLKSFWGAIQQNLRAG